MGGRGGDGTEEEGGEVFGVEIAEGGAGRLEGGGARGGARRTRARENASGLETT